MMNRARQSGPATKTASLVGLAGLALAGAALIANHRASKAERRHPALGRFVTAGGARLHYARLSACTERSPAVTSISGRAPAT